MRQQGEPQWYLTIFCMILINEIVFAYFYQQIKCIFHYQSLAPSRLKCWHYAKLQAHPHTRPWRHMMDVMTLTLARTWCHRFNTLVFVKCHHQCSTAALARCHRRTQSLRSAWLSRRLTRRRQLGKLQKVINKKTLWFLRLKFQYILDTTCFKFSRWDNVTFSEHFGAAFWGCHKGIPRIPPTFNTILTVNIVYSKDW